MLYARGAIETQVSTDYQALRAALIRLARLQAATAGVRTALRALAGLVSALKMKHGDIEVALDVTPERRGVTWQSSWPD